MFTVGTTDSKYLRLIAATREALHAAVAVCKPDAPFSTIGDAIQTVADRYGCVSVKEFVGHGIGHHMHMPPQIHHYRTFTCILLRALTPCGVQHCYALCAQVTHTLVP
uniref:Methionine aminopeptidase 1B, chloroplastic n=1 Tax=Lygus hesperus TaxID=30085 RepID=A0A0A9X9B1_LYGHE